MRVLIACESSGRVRDAFIARGHDAMSCDLLPTEQPGPHYQGDVRDVLQESWDMMVAHPECTYLANSSVQWLSDMRPGDNFGIPRWKKLFEAAAFFRLLHGARHIPMRAIENPIPHKYAIDLIGREYDQIVHPWQFGHEEMKSTCLWLDGLPRLKPTDVVGPPPKDAELRKAWAKVHRMWPGPERKKNRSRTYEGIADAMAQQWGGQALELAA
jgi:hypothetical protein